MALVGGTRLKLRAATPHADNSTVLDLQRLRQRDPRLDNGSHSENELHRSSLNRLASIRRLGRSKCSRSGSTILDELDN